MNQGSFWQSIQRAAAEDFTLFGLRFLLIAWAFGIILAALTIKNKWVLGGLLAYEVLP